VEAVALCEEALARAREVEDRLNIAWSLCNLSLTRPIRTPDDLLQSVAQLEEALDLFRVMGDGWGTSHALRRLGWALIVAGEHKRAATFLQEALTLARSAQNKHAIAWSLFLLGKVVWLLTKDAQHTGVLLQESLSLARQTRNPHLLQQVIFTLGQIAYSRERYTEARSRYAEVVAVAQEQAGGDYPGWFLRPVVHGFAQLAVACGQPGQAARLFGAAHQVPTGANHIFAERIDPDHDINTAREQLGEAAFAVAFAAGQEWSIAQAISYALESFS